MRMALRRGNHETHGAKRRSRNSTCTARFNAEDAKVFAKAAEEFSSASLCENLCALCV